MPDFEFEHTLKLVGYKVTGVIRRNDLIGLRMSKRTKDGVTRLTAFIACDPEINGPGHLDIKYD